MSERRGVGGAPGLGGHRGAGGGPETDRLPDGFTVRLVAGVIRADGGRTLFGGMPARLLSLTPTARRLLATDELTVTDPASALLARILLDRGMADPVFGGGARPDGIPTAREVTVVVPVRDRPEALARLLAALKDGSSVIVVDDGSADDSCAATARAAGARVVTHPRSRGPAAARNTGLALVTTPLVAFVDSDVEPAAGWLDALLPHFADPAVALVAPRVSGAASVERDVSTSRLRRWVAAYEESRSSLDLGPAPALVLPRGRVSYVPTATVVARTVALGDGFAEEMLVGEDVDLVWRLGEAGWRVRYEPAARVDHEHRVVVGDWLRRKAFYGTSAAPLALRHPGAVPPLASAPWAAVVWALLLLQRRWSVAAAALVWVGAVARLARRLRRSDRPVVAAVRLTPWALVSTGWQTASLLMRHWWPLTVLGCLRSRRLRRAAAVAAVVEALADRRRVTTSLGPFSYALAHRLDDLAYGTGLWWGALRHRTLGPLLPSLSSHPNRRVGPDRPGSSSHSGSAR